MNSIYVLIDPRTKEVKYVGKSVNPEVRLKGHCSQGATTSTSRWVRDVIDKTGFPPTMEVIESGLSEDDWPERERYWIDYYLAAGAKLENRLSGGIRNVKRLPMRGDYDVDRESLPLDVDSRMVIKVIRIDANVWKKLKFIANERGSTASTMVREAIHEIIKKEKKGK